uniref:Uncharacterized protein n=1 Tax=Arundo donax TaxID=35708 RepID=A0A0A9CA13_ARUDO
MTICCLYINCYFPLEWGGKLVVDHICDTTLNNFLVLQSIGCLPFQTSGCYILWHVNESICS